jgi:hypothetical protein
MRIEQQRMTCFKCKHVFEGELVVDAPIEVAIAAMKSISCPKCGNREVGLGGAYSGAPPLTTPIEVRASWWWDNGERGTSSETIFSAMSGKGGHRFDYPYDPDDFRRCRALLDLIPEWRADLSKVSERFPWFTPFAENWDTFDALWNEEFPTGKAPKLYQAMQSAREVANKLKYAFVEER